MTDEHQNSDNTVREPDAQDKGAAGRRDLATTVERARAVLERSRQVGRKVADEDKELDDLLVRNEEHLAAAAYALSGVTDEERKVLSALKEARQAVTFADNHLEAFARVALRARADAEALPGTEDLEEAQDYAEKIAKAGNLLLQSPMTEDTRENQRRVLIVSAIALLVSSGLASIEKMSLGGTDLKFDPAKLLWLVVATGVACVYCLTAFLSACRRDFRIGDVAHANSAVQLRAILKRVSTDYAVRLESYVDILGALQSIRELPEFVNGLKDVRARESRLEVLKQTIGMLNGVIQRGKALGRLRLWVEILLPVTVAIIALGMCVIFVLRTTGAA
jgi:hypothetical protein